MFSLCVPPADCPAQVVVHQDCYGVRKIPKGEWLCATCKSGVPPHTALCPMCPVQGGAMKVCFARCCASMCVLLCKSGVPPHTALCRV